MSLKWPFLLFVVAVQGGTKHDAAAQGVVKRPRPAATGAASGVGTTAFVNVSVIPMDKEQVLAGQTVLVRGDKIIEVGPSAQVKVPTGATRVEGQGKFLIPGLGDMNMRIFWPDDDGKIADWYAEPRLFCYVANGVTTVRVIAQDTAIQLLTRRIDKGEMVGPRLYVAGTFNGEPAKRFAELRAAGIDFVYVGPSSSGPEQIDSAIGVAARQAGVRLTGDVAPPLSRAFSAQYASIDQLQGYLQALAPDKTEIPARPTPMVWDSLLATTPPVSLDETKIPALAAATQKAGVWNVPMQIQAEMMIELWTGNKTPAKTSSIIKTRQKLIKALQDAGAGLLLGTGAPTWGSDYGFAVHQELERLVGAGLTPYQALETGTRNIATFLGTQDSVGTIAAGKRADLVLLNANPLESISNTAKQAGVMLKGQWLGRSKLDAKLKTDNCIGR